MQFQHDRVALNHLINGGPAGMSWYTARPVATHTSAGTNASGVKNSIATRSGCVGTDQAASSSYVISEAAMNSGTKITAAISWVALMWWSWVRNATIATT